MTRRFQFSLRALLVAALIAPPAGCWLVRSRQAAVVAHDYLTLASFYRAGTATFQQVYNGSLRLQNAEIAVPFANRRAALVGYLDRLADLEEREKGIFYYGVCGEGMIDILKARLAAISAERQALEAELGLKAKSSFGDS